MCACFVPGCTTRVETLELENRTLFSFPKDENRLLAWKRALPLDAVIGKSSKVCDLHFDEDCIIKSRLSMIDGKPTVVAVRPVLKPGAIPTRFQSIIYLWFKVISLNSSGGFWLSCVFFYADKIGTHSFFKIFIFLVNINTFSPPRYSVALRLCMAKLRVLLACNQITLGSCVCSWVTSLALSPPRVTENNVGHYEAPCLPTRWNII